MDDPAPVAGHAASDFTASRAQAQHVIPGRPPATAGDRAFLRVLVRAFVHAESAAELAVELGRTAPAISSWRALERLLQTHRCSAIAYRVLSQPEVRAASVVPPETIERLRGWYMAAFAQVAMEPNLLGNLLDAFVGAGIPVLFVKGLVVGTWLYDDPVLREHADIDLIVPALHADGAHAVLTELGYVGTLQPPLYFGEAPATADYAGRPGQSHVDLSFDPLRVFWPPDAENDPFGGWQARRIHLSIGGRLVPTLGPEDQFVHLARHLQFHDYFRANWFIDLMLLLHRYGGQLDWDLIGSIAGEHGLRGGLYRTLELATCLYDAAVPEPAWRVLRPNPVVRHIHRRIWPNAIAAPRDRPRKGGTPISPRFLSPFGTHPFAGLILLSLDRNRGRNLQYLVRRVVPPKAWLRVIYGDRAEGDQSYSRLLLRHWRELRSLRRRVRRRHEIRRR